MKAYIAIKYHADNRNRERIAAIAAALGAAGFETVCVTRDLERWGAVHFDAATLMARSFQELETCDVVIVDLTEKGVGVGIEAGYAAARGIPIVAIAQAGAPISDTLRGISRAVVMYTHPDELTGKIMTIPDLLMAAPRPSTTGD
ncbi:MAG: nucleoside 2-deoxyribosyltransferase [Anaerolineae bacterium]|nr:nucleoside 2-deoxyribosyltransferase [Anaerolineae bacterium]